MTASPDRIPLVDLGAQHRALAAPLRAAVDACVAASGFVGGPEHAAFAKDFAAWCGLTACAPVSNGTDALALALRERLGVPGERTEVIVPAMTFIATGEAVTQAGYRPVFVDVLPDNLLIDPDAVAAAITPRTAAVVPVHLYGQMADMRTLAALAERHDLAMIEDAAQAHGARRDGTGPGALSDGASFSFYPGKNLGAWGDAGAVVSRDGDLIHRVVMRANHGRQGKYTHEFEGVNARMDGLQAAILRVKLPHLADWNAARRAAAARYDALLADVAGVTPLSIAPASEPVYHLYVVRVAERDRVLKHLDDAGIGAGVHYPIPLHMQPAYAGHGHAPEDFPVAARAAGEILSLPLFPEITEAQIARVAAVLAEAVG